MALTTEKMRRGRRTSPEMGVAVAVSVSADFVEGVGDSGGWTFSSGDGDRLKSADSWISGCSPLASGEDTTTCRALLFGMASRWSDCITGGGVILLSSPRVLRRIGGTLASPSEHIQYKRTSRRGKETLRTNHDLVHGHNYTGLIPRCPTCEVELCEC